MKALILSIVTLGISLSVSANGETQKTFMCENALKTAIATEKEVRVMRKATLTSVDWVVLKNIKPEVMPAVGTKLVYSEQAQQDVVILVKDLTEREVFSSGRDKGGMDSWHMYESYKIKVDISVPGLTQQALDMDCKEWTTSDY